MNKCHKFTAAVLSATLAFLYAVPVHAQKVSAPTVSARSAVLIEADSCDVIFEKDPDKVLPMASTTKIMTALVAIERADLNDVVVVDAAAVGVEGSSVYLKAGEKLTLRELLYALMLSSANDAAAAIAYHVAGGIDEFADMMNETASSLELRNTHFTNPHGLDDEKHYTTARDLAVLAACALQNETFRRIVSTERQTITMSGGEGTRVLVNHNKMLRIYDGAIGVKTGFTKRCGRCLVSAAERDGVMLVAVTLNAPDDWDDHAEMLDYGFARYESVTLAEAGQFFTDLPCIGGEMPSVRCSNSDTLKMNLPQGTKIAVRIEADRYFPAPVKAGDALATVIFFAEGEEIARLPLYAEHDVAESTAKLSFVERILQFLGR